MSNVSSNHNVMRSCGPVNQGNANVSPTTNIRQSHVTSQKSSSNATASTINGTTTETNVLPTISN